MKQDYEQIERERYNKTWKSMNKGFSKQPEEYRSNVPNNAVVKFFEYIKTKIPNGKMLDIGCGNGRNTKILSNQYECIGIDISKYAIEIAKEHVKNAKFKVDSILNTKLNEQFDIIIDCGCLSHLRKSEWNLYKKNLLKLLKSNGYYLLVCFSNNTPYIKGGFAPKSKNRNWTVKAMHYNHFFSIEEIKEFAKKLTIEKIEVYQKKPQSIQFYVVHMRRI